MSDYAPLEGAEDVGRDSMQGGGAGETDRMVVPQPGGAARPGATHSPRQELFAFD